MIYKLSTEDTQYLKSLPETGIGYQLISAKKLGETQLKKYVVFNSEIAIEYKNKLVNCSQTLGSKEYCTLIQSSKTIDLEEISLIDCDENSKKTLFNTTNSGDINNDLAKPSDIYIRPSIYQKDNRLDFENRVLLPGSYVTTLESYTNCHIMHEDPAEKYSLPVQEEGVKIHYIRHENGARSTNETFDGVFGKKGGGIKLNFNEHSKLIV